MSGLRILLLGKDGQVGFEAQRALASLGTVTAVGRGECDLADVDALRACIRAARPEVVVNAAAFTAVDKAESDRDTAFAVNARAPGIIGETAPEALIVHFSTDYVFDGEGERPYVETDAPRPQSVYGESKLEGERTLATANSRHAIFRTSWVFGVHGGNFLKTMLKLGTERDALRIVGDQHGAPTPAWLIADVAAQCIARSRSSGIESGLYHLAPRGATTWFDYAAFAFEEARRAGASLKVTSASISRIATADYPLPARRPANSRLAVDKLERTFDLAMPPWQDGVARAVRQLLGAA